MTDSPPADPPDLIVVGIGGHALTANGALDGPALRQAAEEAARQLAPLALRAQLVITHGNGPQIGRLAIESAIAAGELHGELRGLDMLDAETEGLMGYALEQALRNELPSLDPAVVLTQVVVSTDDPAFQTPTKPIGPALADGEASRLASERGWTLQAVEGGRRRIVPSPEPVAILEIKAIKALIDADVTVICAGGGGIPVARTPEGLRGVDAVIDKDAVSALLAISLEASALLLLTDVDSIYEHWRMPQQRSIPRATVGELAMIDFEPGTMAPKVAAACHFATATGRTAGIGRLADASAILDGHAGTLVRSH